MEIKASKQTINYRKSDKIKQAEQQIINTLKERYCSLSNRSIKFSDYIDISIENNRLNLHIANKGEIFPVAQNMQTDGTAFEGWAISLKSWLPDEINAVTLTWDRPKEQNGHYNRFLYRVWRFYEMYEWFEFEDRTEDLEIFKLHFTGSRNNSGNKKPRMKEKDCEEQVEHYMVEDNQDIFKRKFNIESLNRHLPVGVKDKNGHSLFTGRNSAIDLWGIGTDSILNIFELKYIKEHGDSKNIKVGIISELLMYVNIINDMRKGIIRSPLNPALVAEKELYNQIAKLNGVKGIFLTNELHPLLEHPEMSNILNANRKNISFTFANYSWDTKEHKISFK